MCSRQTHRSSAWPEVFPPYLLRSRQRSSSALIETFGKTNLVKLVQTSVRAKPASFRGTSWICSVRACKGTAINSAGWLRSRPVLQSRQPCRTHRPRVPPLQHPAPVQVVPPLPRSNTAPSHASSRIDSDTLVPALCSTQASLTATFRPLHASKIHLLSFPKYTWQCSPFTENIMYLPLFALCLHVFQFWLSKGNLSTFSMCLGWALLRSERHSIYLLSCWIVPAQIWAILHLGGLSKLSWNHHSLLAWKVPIAYNSLWVIL